MHSDDVRDSHMETELARAIAGDFDALSRSSLSDERFALVAWTGNPGFGAYLRGHHESLHSKLRHGVVILRIVLAAELEGSLRSKFNRIPEPLLRHHPFLVSLCAADSDFARRYEKLYGDLGAKVETEAAVLSKIYRATWKGSTFENHIDVHGDKIVLLPSTEGHGATKMEVSDSFLLEACARNLHFHAWLLSSDKGPRSAMKHRVDTLEREIEDLRHRLFLLETERDEKPKAAHYEHGVLRLFPYSPSSSAALRHSRSSQSGSEDQGRKKQGSSPSHAHKKAEVKSEKRSSSKSRSSRRSSAVSGSTTQPSSNPDE